jgi:hypothetical protein
VLTGSRVKIEVTEPKPYIPNKKMDCATTLRDGLFTPSVSLYVLGRAQEMAASSSRGTL